MCNGWRETEGEHGGEIVRGEGRAREGRAREGRARKGRVEQSRRLYLTGERGSEREREETEGVSVR